MKKNFSVIFIFMAIMLMISITFGHGKVNVIAEENTGIKIESKSAYLIEPETKTVIYSKNEDERLPIASMCKIMTLLLCFENIDSGNLSLEENITVSENASKMGGSQIFLETNGEYKVSELIKGIVVASANDACVAMSERISGTEDAFVHKMNEKAQELGMKNTNFVNCTGLPKAGQYSSAKDVSVMFSNLLKHKEYYNFSKIWMDKIHHPNDRITEISNTNKLIRFYDGCDSGKTGYTGEAGHCLCASAKRNGMRLISVVISAPDGKTRFKETSDIFNYGFNSYVNKMLIDDKKPLNETVKVNGGKKNEVALTVEKPLFLLSKRTEKRIVDIEVSPLQEIKAPVNKGDVLGKITVYENGIAIEETNIIANESVEKANIFDYMKNSANNWNLVG